MFACQRMSSSSSRAAAAAAYEGPSMRLLPVGPDHAGGVAHQRLSRADRSGHRCRHGRQLVPLHDLCPHPQRHQTGCCPIGRLLPMSELEHIRARFRAAPLPSRDVVPNSGFEGARPRLLRGAFSRRETEREPGTTLVAPAIGNAIFAAVACGTCPSGQPPCSRRSRHKRRSTDTFPCGHQTNFERVMEATDRCGTGQHTS